jgi:hypothetical protein
MPPLCFTDADDPIDIRMDNIFKVVFTRDSPEPRGALSAPLSARTGREMTEAR